jgi:putative spermidine/putrescine transport system permease protein
MAEGNQRAVSGRRTLTPEAVRPDPSNPEVPARPATARRRTSRGAHSALLLAPGALLLVLAYFVPVLVLTVRSFGGSPWGLGYYIDILTDSALTAIIGRTVWVAALTTVASAFLGYAFAYAIRVSSRRTGRTLLAIVLVVIFLSYLVRVYVWLAVLQPNGIAEKLFTKYGIPGFQLIESGNLGAVLIGNLQYTIPFMVLPIYDSMTRVDDRLMRAAESLGAPPVTRFFKVYLPLTLPGVVAGTSIVFITSMGFIVGPVILGGPQNTLVGAYLYKSTTSTLQYESAAAMSSLLLLAVLVVIVVLYRRAVGPFANVRR